MIYLPKLAGSISRGHYKLLKLFDDVLKLAWISDYKRRRVARQEMMIIFRIY